MDSDIKLYLERAENEFRLAEMIMKISNEKELQIEKLKVGKVDTYYSAVISHSYYSVFYAAKGYLKLKGITTKMPEEHKKTYEEFSKLVSKGIVDRDLLAIYEDIMIKAETLLGIFKMEKIKRAEFTYKRMPQANIGPARISLENAEKFFRQIYVLCEGIK